MSEQLIEQYMRELSEQAAACSAACAEADKELEEMQHQLEIKASARVKLAEPFVNKMDELRERIKSLALVGMKTIKCQYGQVKYRKGGVRRSWDLDPLDSICAAFPEIKDRIWPFRHETTTDPSVTIELRG